MMRVDYQALGIRINGLWPAGAADIHSTHSVMAKSHREKSQFELLVDELPLHLAAYRARARARRKPMLVLRKPAPPSVGAVLAKAHDALNQGNLSADQRGRLMLKMADVPQLHVQNDARATLAKLAEVERQLSAGATASHLKAATELAHSAHALLASGRLQHGDHSALTLAMSNLREKIEKGEVVDG